MCRALQISPSGYYAWRVRPESTRERDDRRLLTHLRAAHAESMGTYGVRRMHAEMTEQGMPSVRRASGG